MKRIPTKKMVSYQFNSLEPESGVKVTQNTTTVSQTDVATERYVRLVQILKSNHCKYYLSVTTQFSIIIK